MGYHFLLQGIFLTQGSNPGLPHCRQTLYHLSHQGSPPGDSWEMLRQVWNLCPSADIWGPQLITQWLLVSPTRLSLQAAWRQRSRREATGEGPKESLTHSNHKMGTSCPPSLVTGGEEGTNHNHAFKALVRTVKCSSPTDSREVTKALSGYPPQAGSDEGGETRVGQR